MSSPARLVTPDQRTGHLPGSSALQPWPFRQSQWPALVELHGADPGAMGEPVKGLAGLDPACPVRASRPSTRAAPQAADRLGAAGRTATLSLAARAPHHLRGRQQLCRPSTGSCHHCQGNAHQSAATGCQPICASAKAGHAHRRSASAKRCSATKAQDTPVQPRHDLGQDHRVRLVWPGRRQVARELV